MNIDIGSKIKPLRHNKIMTQEQHATALHVSAQAVSKWDNGKSYPAQRPLCCLARPTHQRRF